MLSDYKENKIFVLYVFSLKTGPDLLHDKKRLRSADCFAAFM